MSKPWYMYVVECNDGSWYCGTTKDLDRRVQQHNCGRGAKYVRGRTPVKLIYAHTTSTRSIACFHESHFKKLNRDQKEQYLKDNERINEVKER
jgi:putative endonuclease